MTPDSVAARLSYPRVVQIAAHLMVSDNAPASSLLYASEGNGKFSAKTRRERSSTIGRSDGFVGVEVLSQESEVDIGHETDRARVTSLIVSDLDVTSPLKPLLPTFRRTRGVSWPVSAA